MIKKEKKKQTTLERSPFMYYVTNWGFGITEQPIKSNKKTQTESLTAR